LGGWEREGKDILVALYGQDELRVSLKEPKPFMWRERNQSSLAAYRWCVVFTSKRDT
jgi:hypothetical protein